jgi:hypothetical protein
LFLMVCFLCVFLWSPASTSLPHVLHASPIPFSLCDHFNNMWERIKDCESTSLCKSHQSPATSCLSLANTLSMCSSLTLRTKIHNCTELHTLLKKVKSKAIHITGLGVL